MKKTRKMKGGGLYMFVGKACSNTAYFETLEDAKLFLQLAQEKLKNYLYIHEYMLNEDGWCFIARLKSKDQILSTYLGKHGSKLDTDEAIELWRIISERMRLFLCEYVVKYNQRTGREGGLVKRSYERYYFETVSEAKQQIRRMRRRKIGLQQTMKKYRAKRGHYSIPKKQGCGTIYLSSRRKKKWVDRGCEGLREMTEGAVFQLFSSEVVPSILKVMLKDTIKSHQTPIPDI